MNRILKATSRGQVTLPKVWRDNFETDYYSVEEKDNYLILKPLIKDSLKTEVEDSWNEYVDGKFVTQDELMDKYGL